MENKNNQLNKYEGKVYCPACLEEGAYGFIYKVKLKKLDKEIYICDECEIIWESQEDILSNHFYEFEIYMRNNGLEPSWSEFEEIKVWYL